MKKVILVVGATVCFTLGTMYLIRSRQARRRIIKQTVENLHMRIAIVDGTTLQQVVQELLDLLLQYRALPALTTACLSPLGRRGENLLGLLLRRMIESERLGKPTTWADFRAAIEALIQICSQETSQLAELLCANDTEGWSPLHFMALGALLPLVLQLFGTDIGVQPLLERRSHVLSSGRYEPQIEPHVMQKMLARLQHILQLQEQCQSDPNKGSVKCGPSLLLCATTSGCVLSVDLLLSTKEGIASLDVGDANGGATALHIACGKGNLPIVQSLLRARASVGIKDKQGRNCVTMAAYGHHLEVLKVLSKHCDGDDAKRIFACADNNGLNPLHVLCMAVQPLDGQTPDDIFTPGVEIEGIIDLLISRSDRSLLDRQTLAGVTPLMLACKRRRADLVQAFLSRGADPLICDGFGSTPLHHVCFMPLIAERRRVSKHPGGEEAESEVPLAMMRSLLDHAAKAPPTAPFGTVAPKGMVGMSTTPQPTPRLQPMLAVMKSSPDNEGGTPLHELCKSIVTLALKSADTSTTITPRGEKKLEMMKIFLGRHAATHHLDTNQRQYCGTTAITILCASDAVEHPLVLATIQLLLHPPVQASSLAPIVPKNGDMNHDASERDGHTAHDDGMGVAPSDPTLADNRGWTALHFLHQYARKKSSSEVLTSASPVDEACIPSALAILKNHCSKSFLDNFDPEKKRSRNNDVYLCRRGPHNRIPLHLREDVLRGERNLAGIAARLKRTDLGRHRIIVLTGAGISVSAGIADYRSPVTGLYSSGSSAPQPESDDTGNPFKSGRLIDARKAFSVEAFVTCPEDIWVYVYRLLSRIRDGSVSPTPTHRFIRTLHEKGLLHRVYTQNVDTLHLRSGLPADKIVNVHGTLSRAYCPLCGLGNADRTCNWSESASWSGAEVMKYCMAAMDKGVLPRCPNPACASAAADGAQPLRPDIVFFGEGVKPKFSSMRQADMEQCSMLIVMGTSLQVYPFAGLPNMAPPLAPRVLINRERTGVFRGAENAGDRSYRDVAFLGDCDDGVREFSRLMGWSDV